MPVQLQHAIVHSFDKVANSAIVDRVVKKVDLLDITLPAVISLVDGVAGLLGKQGNALTYGQFGEDFRQGRFPPTFLAYSQDHSNPATFLTLSQISLDELCECAADELLATGGHILAASYFIHGNPYVLIAMIKQRGGVSLDENYVPIEITEIDLSKVYQAARININSFIALNEAAVEEADEAEERTYLCFLGQNKGNSASAYFVKALGCVKGITAARATGNVIDAVQKFFKDEHPISHLRSKARDQVVAYLQRVLEAGNLATLEDIVHEVSGIVPGELRAHAEGMLQFLNDDKYKIPAQFDVDEKTLKRKIRIKGENSQWAIQFEQNILGEDGDSKILYDRTEKTLTINDLGEGLILKIEAELDSRN